MDKIGITAGSFDLCHPGHLLFFQECKQLCQFLIVCLQTNPQIDRPEKNYPCETIFERWMRLRACRFIDEIIPYDTEEDLINILHISKWDKRFLDHTYQGKKYTGSDIRCNDNIFIERNHNYSTTRLRERINGKK